MKVVISQQAQDDLLAGYRFYERRYYRMIAKRFPFAVYYKIESREARVRRVLDCRRNPAWLQRQLKR